MKLNSLLTSSIIACCAYAAQASADGLTGSIGDEPAVDCSNAAAAAVSDGHPSGTGLIACNDAIRHQTMTRHELAATYLNRGVLYLVRGDQTAAIADDNAALSLEPGLVEALLDRGAAFAAEHRPADAAGDFTQALALGPKQPAQVYYNRALAREDMGNMKGAYLDYQQAAKLDPSWAKPRQELTRFTVAHAPEG